MADYARNFSTPCTPDLVEDINLNPNISPTCVQIIDLGNGNSIFQFDATLSGAEETELDTTLTNWECPVPEGELDEATIDDGIATVDNLWTANKTKTYVDTEITAVSAGDPTNLTGKMYSTGFAHSSRKVTNAWMRQESNDSGAASDRVPFIVPFDGKIVSVTYVNAGGLVDCDIQIWKSAAGVEPDVDRTNIHTFELRNERAAVETDFTGSDMTVNRGDKIAIYHRDQGTNSNHPVVHLNFVILDATVGNATYNFANRFSG